MRKAGGARQHGAASCWQPIARGLVLVCALQAAPLLAAVGAPQDPLTSVRAIHSLSNPEAAQGIPVRFTATVTYFRGYDQMLYVQTGPDAVSVQTPAGVRVSPGDVVEIKGRTQGGFRPSVVAESVSVTGQGPLPPPVEASFDDLLRTDLDARLVKVFGIVRDAETIENSGVRSTLLDLHVEGGEIGITVDVDNPDLMNSLLDAQVAVTGAVSGRFDGKMQQTGLVLHAASMEDVEVLRYAALDPWSLPLSPMDRILSSYHESNLSERIRVHGTITYYQPGSMVVLQDGLKSLWVMTSTMAPLHVGDAADATGFPDVHDGFLALTGAHVRDLGEQQAVKPQPSTWDSLASSHNLFDLVSIEGELVAQVRGASQDEYVLAADGNLFSAIYRHPPAEAANFAPLASMRVLQPGSKVRVTGVCFVASSNFLNSKAPFNILLRSAGDLQIISAAPWSTAHNLLRLVALLAVVVLVVFIWGWTLRRRVRQQTAVITARIEAEAAQERRLVQLEQWRSRILEDINSSRPLGEILDHIMEMVSFLLRGASCWCELTDGTRYGKTPIQRSGLRVIGKEITSPAGGSLGILHAAIIGRPANAQEESAALAQGVRLASLAMETRKLYSDLVYRSEFDLLTDVYNRFSLEKYLEEQIEKARERSTVLGLIYLDLDEFKQVNDMYGHHVGDLYLQEVAARMRRQLRTGDMLARLGGDEFAALVPVVRTQADVEEICQRLEHCFDAPFEVEHYLLRGSASLGIALYPIDGTTPETLLKAADTAMYIAKESKRHSGAMPSQSMTPGLPFRD
ncbi:MAG: GGDEF domain-containing protein [Acidobacteriota bacterium]|nr:GGDEF domain-containing protein [Acidobacteriota bacterium]